jgi:parallel beta-helix repeat protein
MKNEEKSMKRKTEIKTVIMIVLLSVTMIMLAFNVKPVKADAQTIYINADGSITPARAPIATSDNITYTFTGDISYPTYNRIFVDRSNIIIDGNGYAVQGNQSGTGIYWQNINNVTIKNTNIENFQFGVWLSSSSNNSISGNNITANSYYGIWLDSSSNNSMTGNNITANDLGICVFYSNDNSISGNNITNNGEGIELYSSSNNSITGNNITANNGCGILLGSSSNYNSISGNDIIANNYDGIYLYPSSNYNSISLNNITANGQNGIFLESPSSSNSISGNNITANNDEGICLYPSSNNSISGNDIAANGYYGIDLYSSSNDNSITGNDITANGQNIELDSSSNNSISGNNITNGYYYGVWLSSSSNNSISGNNITNNGEGIEVEFSSSNSITGNNITANSYYGIDLYSSSSNSITGNDITANNDDGIWLDYSSNNTIYHNNFMNNTYQFYASSSTNTWDDGYPSGGNYWSDYNGIDLYKGPYQNMTGSDGIGDTPYVIDTDNIDHYPLMYPYVPQYYLTVVSPYDTAGGMGWYDWGANAYATLATGAVDIVPGWVRAVFTGWSGDATGAGLTSDPIFVNGPKTAIADWKIEFYLQVVTNPSNVTTIPGEAWYDNWTYVNLTAPQYVPSAMGISGVRYNFTYWDVDGVSLGAGVNPISVHMDTNHVATAYFTLQCLVVFNQTGVGSDFNGTVVVIDGSNYSVSGLPASFWYDDSSTHTFAFQSPLVVGSGAKEYDWNFTGGLSADQSGSIIVTGSGNVTGNYVTKVHDVAVNTLTAAPTIACQGYGCLIDLTIANEGNFTETFNVTIYANMTDTDNVTAIYTFENVTLNSRDSTMLTFIWDTTGFDPGNYTISTYVTLTSAETNVADSIFIGNTVQIIQASGGGAGRMPYMD